MPKYLFQGSYTLEGVKGLVKEGGTSRRSLVKDMVENLGGQLEAFYYGFGGEDAFIIADLPDNVSTAAISLAAAAGGGFRGSTTVLLTAEEIDQSCQKVASVGYRPPGQVQ